MGSTSSTLFGRKLSVSSHFQFQDLHTPDHPATSAMSEDASGTTAKLALLRKKVAVAKEAKSRTGSEDSNVAENLNSLSLEGAADATGDSATEVLASAAVGDDDGATGQYPCHVSTPTISAPSMRCPTHALEVLGPIPIP